MANTRGERAILCCRQLRKLLALPETADYPDLVDAVKKLASTPKPKAVKRKKLVEAK